MKKIKLDKGNIYITVKIQPKSSNDQIVGWQEDGSLKIKVSAPPVEGSANKKLIEIISKKLGVAKSRIKIISGGKSKEKAIEICGVENIDKSKIEELLSDLTQCKK
jgi:hypothetical protein